MQKVSSHQDRPSTARTPLVVVSRDGTEAAGVRARFEDVLLAELRAHGVEPLVTPHLYYLVPSHPAIVALEEKAGDLVVGAWMHVRAAFWTLRALGVHGTAAANQAGERLIHCLDLGTFASPAECARALGAAAGGWPAPREGATAPIPAGGPPVAVRPRWYPVIDGSLCANCGKCLDFCLFGVYSLRGGRVVASSPDNCKDGCPACARTCPTGAIMFPHYFSDPTIAGAGPLVPPSRAAAPRAESDGSRADAPKRPMADDLDALISALEKLDE